MIERLTAYRQLLSQLASERAEHQREREAWQVERDFLQALIGEERKRTERMCDRALTARGQDIAFPESDPVAVTERESQISAVPMRTRVQQKITELVDEDKRLFEQVQAALKAEQNRESSPS